MSCPECFQAHVHEGTPSGRVTKLHGLDTYIASPHDGDDQADGIIIIVPDAFGWDFVNNRLLADHYARDSNFTVYLPDFMVGRSAPQWLIDPMARVTKPQGWRDYVSMPYNIGVVIYGAIPWLWRNRLGLAWPRMRSFFEAVRLHEAASLPIGAAGFCWGGWPVLTLASASPSESQASNGKPLADVVFTGHPSMLSLPADVEKVAKPTSMAIGDADNVMPMKQVEEVKKLWAGMAKKSDGKPVETEIVVYPGAGHGFCVRVDQRNENQYQQSLEAERQAVAWFKKHMKKQ